MIFRVNIARVEIAAFLALALFSNLLGRMFSTGLFNGLYYVALGLLFIDAIRHRPPNRIQYLVFGLIAFFGLYILDWRTPLQYNALTIKDIIAPLMGLAIGFLFARDRLTFVNYLNPLYLVFVGYSVFQQIAFYTMNLAGWLPWDDAHITSLLEDGAAGNLYQGGLLRFFGPMNTFAEGQIFIVVLGLTLALFRADLRRHWIFVVNMLLAVAFLVLAVERSAILMAVIILAVWLLPVMARRLRYVAICLLAIPLLIFSVGLFADSYIQQDPELSYAYERLVAAITLDFSGDEALRERVEGNWQQAIEIAQSEYFGIGPGRVTPGARNAPGYIGPHNNYLLFHLAYGVIGLLGFLIMIAQALESFRVGRREVRFFAFGLVGAYCLLAFFNLPFASRNGTMFFVLLGLLLAAASRGGNWYPQVTGAKVKDADAVTVHH